MEEATLSPPGAAIEFDGEALHDLRHLVATKATAAGMAEDRVIDFVLAASEVGTNSVAHGGGWGSARLWREAEALVLEVRDRGIGRVSRLPIPESRPAPSQERGRGLWIVDQLCDSVRIRSGGEGTSVRLSMSLA